MAAMSPSRSTNVLAASRSSDCTQIEARTLSEWGGGILLSRSVARSRLLTRPQTALQRASLPRAAHFRADALQQGVRQVTEYRRPRRGDGAVNAGPIKFIVLVADHPRRSGVETEMQFHPWWKGDRAAVIRWGLGGDRRHRNTDRARRSPSNGDHDNAGPDLAPAVFARFVLVSPKTDVRNDEARLGNHAARHISRPSVRQVGAVGGRGVCSAQRRDRPASPRRTPPSASSRGP